MRNFILAALPDLRLQEHHGELRTAGFSAAGDFPRPEHAVKAVAQVFDFERCKAIELVAGGSWVEAQCVGKACF